MNLVRRLFVAGLVMALLAGGTAAYALLRRPAPGPAVDVTLSSGMSTVAIARELREQEVIGSELGFRVMSRARGLDGRIQAGRYELRRGMGVQAALDALTNGPEVRAVSVTIPEGFTVRQILARIADRTHITRQDLERAAGSGDIRAGAQPSGVSSLEGFLLPDTYVVSEHDTAESVIRRMVRTFDERTASLDFSPATSRGLSVYEAIVLASLVEREAKVAEDRAKVAAVVYNRLEKGMRLQIDATVLYDLPEHKVPNRRDLERDTPYNTYLNEGLPPTPIANPGMAAIRATLEPAGIDALYYVVIDPSGRHGFTADYAEFQRMLRLRPAETRG